MFSCNYGDEISKNINFEMLKTIHRDHLQLLSTHIIKNTIFYMK